MTYKAIKKDNCCPVCGCTDIERQDYPESFNGYYYDIFVCGECNSAFTFQYELVAVDIEDNN